LRVCFGLKAHCGWSALVVLGSSDGEPRVVDRRRVELVEPDDARWTKQPYHAADGLQADEARKVVERGIESARRIAVRELQAQVQRSQRAGHALAGCAVLVPEAMPDWSIDQILAVHLRMHQAEGVLFPDALARAAQSCGVPLLRIRQKQLGETARKALAATASQVADAVAALGRPIGPPWGKDQKDAALAALVAFGARRCARSTSTLSVPE
jgi:hypothetical protein